MAWIDLTAFAATSSARRQSHGRGAQPFSKATMQLIGERTMIAGAGEVTGATAIIARAFVDRRGQVPSADKSSAS